MEKWQYRFIKFGEHAKTSWSTPAWSPQYQNGEETPDWKKETGHIYVAKLGDEG